MSRLDFIHRAREAQERHERRINVQLSLLTGEELSDRLTEQGSEDPNDVPVATVWPMGRAARPDSPANSISSD